MSLCLHPCTRVGTFGLNLEAEWFFIADTLWLQKFPFAQSSHSLSLKLFERSSVGATQARPEGVCLSIFFFVHHVWQVVAWDPCSRINLQGCVVCEKPPLLCRNALRSRTCLTRLSVIQVTISWYQQSICMNRKIVGLLRQPGVSHLSLLIYFSAVHTSPPDPTRLPSNRALIVQRDAFFISAYEILKNLRNVCSAMRT